MFEKYFVTCPVAVALKEAGFDEPCMAVWRNAAIDDTTQPTLQICYDSDNPSIWMCLRRNGSLPDWQFAAPLYQQALEWLESKGLYLHLYKIPPLEFNSVSGYGVNIFLSDGNMLWPEIVFESDPNKFRDHRKKYLHFDKRDAWEQAILAAIKLFNDEPKVDV